MAETYVYMQNSSETPIALEHPVLRDAYVACVPGGLIATKGRKLVIEPEHAVKVPLVVWITAGKNKAGLKRLTEDEFACLAHGVDPADLVPPPVIPQTEVSTAVTENELPEATTLSEEAIIEIARQCHEANREYCQSIGDDSQLPWDEAPQWQKDSIVAGVKAIINDPDITTEQLHECWMALKIADGWVYGEEKNTEVKTHPCLVPYGELPEEQRSKDDIFQTTAKAGIAEASAPLPEVPETAEQPNEVLQSEALAKKPEEVPATVFPCPTCKKEFPNRRALAAHRVSCNKSN